MPKHALPPSADRGVLIVEDEPEICGLVAEALEEAGFRPLCIGTGREADAALRETGPFACLIVDVNLGSGVTGYDVARLARAIDAKLPVIYVSGQTSEYSFKANGVPGSSLMTKPFTVDELVAHVTAATRAAGLAAMSRRPLPAARPRA